MGPPVARGETEPHLKKNPGRRRGGECATLAEVMNATPASLLILWLCAAATAADTCGAAARSDESRLVLASAAVSMDQAVRMVEQRYHARVVKAETQSDGSRTLYVLRLLDDSGKVWTVRVDSTSGSVQ